MKPAHANRLVGICVCSTLTIVFFDLKMIWLQMGLPGAQRLPGLPATILVAALAGLATVGTWRERPWGFLLTILLCARENIAAVRSFYSYPANFRTGDIFAQVLSGIPVALGMIAAL